MISYLITHFNRPYFLDIHIQLIRRYAPRDTQIVIADDGSDSSVVEAIKQLQIDDIYVQPHNLNLWKKGSYSNTLKSAIKLCRGDIVLTAEDDFFYSPTPILCDNPEREGFVKGVIPEMYFPEAKFSVFDESIELLKRYKDIYSVQISRDHLRVPITSQEVSTSNIKWYRIDPDKKGRYYCLWPILYRREDFLRLNIPDDMSVWVYDKYINAEGRKVFGNSACGVVPANRFYVHVGYAFSQRKNDFMLVQPRQDAGMKLQQQFSNKIFSNNLEDFNKYVVNSYCKGVFKIDFSEMLNDGLVKAFSNAFARI